MTIEEQALELALDIQYGEYPKGEPLPSVVNKCAKALRNAKADGMDAAAIIMTYEFVGSYADEEAFSKICAAAQKLREKSE